MPEADHAGDALPKHVAIVMDGNGRWAQQRGHARAVGHRIGVRAVRAVIRAANRMGVQVLTLFAFSQENWQRPAREVHLLMRLFAATLRRELAEINEQGIRLRFIGDHAGLVPELRTSMHAAEQLTAANTALQLVIAVGYGGKWDIVQAASRLCAQGEGITADRLEAALSTQGLPPVDLMIRTGGECRISNFLLWQLAYAELYFTPVLWPDFDETEFERAVRWFGERDRRFGRVGTAF